MAALGRQTSVPLAVWRTIHKPADVFTAARSNVASFVVVDLQQVGGIVPARACAAVATAAGITPLLGSRRSLGVATAAMLHVAAATAAFSAANEFGQQRNSLLTDSLEIADGMIAVPQSPGLGVKIDRARLDEIGIKS